MKKFSYHKPRSLEQACALLGRYGQGAAVLAGGTDLLPSPLLYIDPWLIFYHDWRRGDSSFLLSIGFLRDID